MKTKLCLLLAVLVTAGLQNIRAADSDLSKLAAANNTFAFNLLKQLATEQPGASIFVSPYSAATALQMAANGAGGQTKTEMQQVLGTTNLTTAELNEASKAAARLLNPNGTNIILTTANALWYRQGAQIKPEFLAANREFFSSTIKALDFANVPAAEAEINQWASDQTHGRITGIANGMIDPLYTDLVLANAIYFKGKWENPFDPKLTKEHPFYPASGAAKNLPMMEMSKKFAYHEGFGFQAVRLPYMGGDMAMYVFLPDPGSNPAKLLQVTELPLMLYCIHDEQGNSMTMPGFDWRDGTVVLPKFKLEDTIELNHPLEAMGMKAAFDPKQADFSDMFSDPHHISKVRQKAFVEVGEEGTEAAAVTMITASPAAAFAENRPKPFEMIVDRPFLFAIVDARSEMILFMGLVNDL